MVTEVYKFAQEIGAATNEQSHGSSQIARATTRLNEITHEINSAVEEQASGAQAVVKAMERMRELVQQSTSGSTELAASAEQMSKMSRELLDAMDRFALGRTGASRAPLAYEERRAAARGMPRLGCQATRRGAVHMSRELHIVGFQVGRETYGVPITSLHEIVRVPEITAVPDAPDYMEGVINLRGKIVSVIDLRKRFGVKESGGNRRNRILVVELNGTPFRTDRRLRLGGAEDCRHRHRAASRTCLQEGGANCVTGLGKYKGRLIVLLDMDKLLDFSSDAAQKSAADAKAALTPKAEVRSAAAR